MLYIPCLGTMSFCVGSNNTIVRLEQKERCVSSSSHVNSSHVCDHVHNYIEYLLLVSKYVVAANNGCRPKFVSNLDPQNLGFI
jgi:hypothetical protein